MNVLFASPPGGLMRGLMPLGFVMCLQFGCSAGGEHRGSAATPPSGSPSESDHSATSETHSSTSDARSEGNIVWPSTSASDSSPQLPFEPPPKNVKVNFGCLDERWLIRRNESGVPPDRTLECAVDYWWSDAGASRSGGMSADSSRDSSGGSFDAGPRL